MRHRRHNRHGGFRFDKIMRTVGPFVAMAAMGGMMAGCQNRGSGFHFDGDRGVPLSELDMSGDAPTEISLMGPDHVVVSEGEDFTISLQGDDEAKDRMRFVLEGGTLSILREEMGWNDNNGEVATVNVTMPPPQKIVIAGSGQLASSALADEAEIAIAGSGSASILDIDISELDVSIAGSGHLTAGGKVRELDLSVAGSGTADMAGLEVEEAEINIAGSGNATFSSDGEVNANIMGSGNVTVRGSARCRVHSMGSGSLVCERREDEAA
jgi:carbon monoxide dehydrogenase subunit G